VAKLSEANPYIRTKEQRDNAIARSVISSSACEGVIVRRELVKAQLADDKPNRCYSCGAFTDSKWLFSQQAVLRRMEDHRSLRLNEANQRG